MRLRVKNEYRWTCENLHFHSPKRKQLNVLSFRLDAVVMSSTHWSESCAHPDSCHLSCDVRVRACVQRWRKEEKKKQHYYRGILSLAHTNRAKIAWNRMRAMKTVESFQFNFMCCVFMTVSNLILLDACFFVSIQVPERGHASLSWLLAYDEWHSKPKFICRRRKANIVVKMTRRDMANWLQYFVRAHNTQFAHTQERRK